MWMFGRQGDQGDQGGQSDVQRDQLLIHLTTYIELHRTHKDRFKNTADFFLQAQEQEYDIGRILLYMYALGGGYVGSVVGTVVGLISGGFTGSLAAVAAAAILRKELNAVSASVGFFGGILGSVVGATFAGFLGGAIGAAVESSGHSAYNELHLPFWGLIGGITGAGIGDILGGKVGLVAGAIGGGVGGFCGVSVPVMLIKAYTVEYDQTNISQQKSKAIKLEEVTQDFKKNTSHFAAELSVIHSISSKMVPGVEAGRVAVQSSLSLTALSKATKAIYDVQITPQTTSCWKKAAQQCTHMCEQLEMMRREAEKVRASWSQ
uniref:Uncharacterized protein n=1 Tax=Knipowitschia caucasica TaxID=637954 RepID=A0AAV2LL53_KNICA